MPVNQGFFEIINHFYQKSVEFYPCEEAIAERKTYLLACYDICLNEDRTLRNTQLIGAGDESEGCKWYAYVRTPEPSG